MKLDGYRTYITASLLILASVAKTLGYLDESTFQTIQGLLLGAGLWYLRAGIETAVKN